MSDNYQSIYRWYILGLAVASGTFVATLPFSCMPPLFKEISEDLGLNLVQIGTVWGLASLAGVFVSIIAGVLGDRFGVKLILSVSCLLVGITGAMRGLSDSFLALSITVFINGIVRFIVPINATKTVGMWFRGQNLGMAMGISAMGMGLGLMLGPMISATILSPLLGGWRNVMHLYGAVSVVIGILWFLFGREPRQVDSTARDSGRVPIRQALSRLIHIKALWFIGFTLSLRVGCIMGMTGYLPLYLREQGWAPASADGTLAAFYGVSTLCVVSLSSLSDRLGSRKVILFPALLAAIVGAGLLPISKRARRSRGDGGACRSPPRRRRVRPSGRARSRPRRPRSSARSRSRRGARRPAGAAPAPSPGSAGPGSPCRPGSGRPRPASTPPQWRPRPRTLRRQSRDLPGWLTHKLATWMDQFDTFGCVGCGRCITWCPVGIDITEEAKAILGESDGVTT